MKLTKGRLAQIQQWDYNVEDVEIKSLGYAVENSMKVGILLTKDGYRKFKIPKNINLHRVDTDVITGYTKTWDGSEWPTKITLDNFIVSFDKSMVFRSEDLLEGL